MKKTFPLISLLAGVFFISTLDLHAQDATSTTVRITITEDGKVTSDTSIAMKEGQDPEMISKVVSALAGADMDVKHRSTHAMTWIESDGDHVMINAEGDHESHGINMDSIREAHPDAETLVIKKKNGKIEVSTEACQEGEESLHEIIVMEDSDIEVEKEVIIIKKGDVDAGAIKQKKVKVFVVEDEEVTDEKGEKHRNIDVTVESVEEAGDDTGKTIKKKKKR